LRLFALEEVDVGWGVAVEAWALPVLRALVVVNPLVLGLLLRFSVAEAATALSELMFVGVALLVL
jgi:uncharacterized ion transporter superfamily protein YfcC